MKQFSIGVDIGGMSIKCGIVNDKGEILCKETVICERNAKKDIENLINLINILLKKQNIFITDIKGVGVGCPGAVNSESGVIEVLPNLNWENVNIVEILKNRLGCDVKITNDANAAALAEYKFGAAKNYKSCVMFTLGTGVGGAYIEDGKMLEGKFGKGTELGHVTLVLDGLPCTCGRKGCIERYASATALIAQTKEAMMTDKSSLMWNLAGDIDKVDGRTSFEAAKKGDKTALLVVDNYVKYLSESIMSMVNIFRPEAFLLGGGISGQGDYLINKIKNYCEKFDYGYKGTPKPEIVCAKLGNDAGIIGAAALF
ncbi:MAG: ROK family glucokinase [Clostridia bacterium]|nr:ROK family glucokinase [Clostridia bacterium]